MRCVHTHVSLVTLAGISEGEYSLLQIAIVITDGRQTTERGPYTEPSVASSRLKYKNVQVYSLGIGEYVDHQQLADIASSKEKVFFADSFAALTLLVQTIVQTTCPGKSSSRTESMLLVHFEKRD